MLRSTSTARMTGSRPGARGRVAIQRATWPVIVAETSLTLMWQRQAFWRSVGNWFDAIVCASSVLSFGLYWFGGATGLLDEAL